MKPRFGFVCERCSSTEHAADRYFYYGETLCEQCAPPDIKEQCDAWTEPHSDPARETQRRWA